MLRRLPAFSSQAIPVPRPLLGPMVPETNDGGAGFNFDNGNPSRDTSPITRAKHGAGTTNPSKQVVVPLSPLDLSLSLSPPPYTDFASPNPFSGVVVPPPLSWNRNEADVEFDLNLSPLPTTPNAGGKGKGRADSDDTLDDFGLLGSFSAVPGKSAAYVPDILDALDEKDFEYAIQLQIEELQRVTAEFEDEKMARKLGGGGETVQDPSPSTPRYNLRPRPSRSGTAAGNASSSTKRKTGVSVNLTRECTSCFESLQLFQGIQSSCEHYYCLTCVRNMVNASLSDNSFALFPPKCCNKPLMAVYAQGTATGVKTDDNNKDFMQIELLGLVLDDAALKGKLERKWKEWSTKDEDRVYCCNANCALFVASAADFEAVDPSAPEASTSTAGKKSPQNSLLRLFNGNGKKANKPEPGIAKCSACQTPTCVSCRQPGHAGKSCTDSGDNLFWDTVKVRGWKKCPGCTAVIEKNGGCSHIVCRCGRSF
ncbi:hypothetical protein F5887DRAFT_981487, partial [Amanita rubescens]